MKVFVRGDRPATATIASAVSIARGTGNAVITIGGAPSGAVVDLGGGDDRPTPSSSGATLTATGVEILIGAATVTARSTEANVGSGGGDVVTLQAGDNAVTISAVETVTGSTDADIVVLASGSPDVITDVLPSATLLVFRQLLSGSFTDRAAGPMVATSGASPPRFDTATRRSQVDTDGDGTADIEIELNGRTASDLGAGNFRWD